MKLATINSQDTNHPIYPIIQAYYKMLKEDQQSLHKFFDEMQLPEGYYATIEWDGYWGEEFISFLEPL